MVEAVKLKALGGYLGAVQKTLSSGYVSEGSHYPALKTLLESLGDGTIATSLPSRIECGATDFIVTKSSTTTGYVEPRILAKSPDEAEKLIINAFEKEPEDGSLHSQLAAFLR